MTHLSPRRLEVTRLVHAGHSYKRIAREMGITVKTVKCVTQRIAEILPAEGQPKVKPTRWFERHYGEAA